MPHLRRLSAVQLAIWADAWTWAQNGKPAYRTNEQLAELFGITVKSVSRAIAGLKSYGMLKAQTVNGRQRILTACIPTNVHPHERPSPSTSIPTNVHAASPSTSMLHPHERPPSIPTNVHQEENREENRIEKRIEKGAKPKKEARPKDLQTVIDAFEQAGAPSHLAQRFWNYYEANGWKAGRNPMKDWKAAARNWVTDRNGYNGTSNPNETAPGFDPQRMAEHIKRKYGTPQT